MVDMVMAMHAELFVMNPVSTWSWQVSGTGGREGWGTWMVVAMHAGLFVMSPVSTWSWQVSGAGGRVCFLLMGRRAVDALLC